MKAYRTAIDPRAMVTRNQLNQLAVRDLGGAMRWALHLSHEELDYLEAHNPDFNMDQFVLSPDSKPFKIGTKV